MKAIPVALVAVGVALRVAAVLFMQVNGDGGVYASMGYEWTQHGEFLMPWGNLVTDSAPAYSHHYSPLWPWTLAAGYQALGFGIWQTHFVALVVSFAALAAVYLCLRDALGKERAAWGAGILAVEPGFILATGTAYAENLALLCFTVTLWGIWRSLRQPAWMLAAGAGAGLGYLTRGGMGAFFLIAAGGGFAWRLRNRGWRALRDPWYWAAAGVFLSCVAGWALRNWLRFGSIESSAYVGFVQGYAFSHPLHLLAALGIKAGLFVAFVALYWLCFKPEFLRAFAAWRKEEDSLFLMAGALVVVIGWWMASAFWLVEQYNPLWFDNHRYVVLAFLPIVWLVVKHADLRRYFQARVVVAGVLFAGASMMVLLVPQVAPVNLAVSDLDLAPGMVVGLDGLVDRYSILPYLHERNVTLVYCPGDCTAAYLLTDHPENRTGYELVRESRVERWLGASSLSFYTYRRTTA